MYQALIIIVAMFTWLGYETNWFTIRLLAGPDLKPCTADEIAALRVKLFQSPGRNPFKHIGGYIATGYAEPICGWEYIRDHQDLTPDYHVELNLGTVKYSMTINHTPAAAGILAEVMRANKIRKAR